jgi:hypothetical protein
VKKHLLCCIGLHKWVQYPDFVGSLYYQCARCNKRTIFDDGLYVPIDYQWLDGGNWTVGNAPPNTFTRFNNPFIKP